MIVHASSPERRKQGKRAGLDRQQIVHAARTLDPRALSMQAVATKLGVDPKALNYHVSDLATLLGLVAEEEFVSRFSETVIVEGADWKDACRAFAIGFADAVLITGAYLQHLPDRQALVTRFLRLNEAVLTKLVEAGFDDEAAVRTIVLLTSVCHAHVRDQNVIDSSPGRRRKDMLIDSLASHEAHVFPHLSRIAGQRVDTYGDEQFLFAIETCIAGLSAGLPRSKRRSPGASDKRKNL